jgi:hypothetical protein
MSLSVSVFSPEERSSADVDENYSKRERDWGSFAHGSRSSGPVCRVATLCRHWRHSRCTIILPPIRLNPAARSNPILPLEWKRSQLPNPAFRGGMATPVARQPHVSGPRVLTATKEHVTFYYQGELCA